MTPAYQRMINKLESASNEDIDTIWDSLKHQPIDPKDLYDREGGIDMETWAMHVYSEHSKRHSQ